MIYAQRNAQGRIVAVALSPDASHSEAVAEDSAEALAFFNAARGDDSGLALAQSDLSLARVLEDLVEVLIDKQLIRFTDLPDAAQQKLLTRRSLRANRLGADFIGEVGSDSI